MKSGKTEHRKLSVAEREVLWIALSAQSMRMIELVRLTRGVARRVRSFEKRLEKRA